MLATRLHPVLLIAFVAQAVHAEVILELEPQPIAVKTTQYEARVEPDGCLTELKLGNINYFAPGVGISRGSYFYQGGPLKLDEVKVTGGSRVEASGEHAAVTYEFAEDQVLAHLKNTSDTQLVFFVVMNGLVGAASVEASEIQETPVTGSYSRASFFIDKHRLEIEGFDKLWGPWQGPHQVVQATLKPSEQRTLSFRPYEATEAQTLKVLSFKAATPESELTITSPREYQVIQRSSRSVGRVLISGRTQTNASSIKLRLIGEAIPEAQQAWRSVSYHPDTRKFSQWLTLPAGGWYRLKVAAVQGEKLLAEAEVAHFGIGEVFVGAGQSNSTNCGQFKTKQTSGMVSSFSGKHWQIANDPQPGVADRSQGGSFWPAFGDRMHRELGVPIGVATTGYGGTSVNQWQPDGDLYQRWFMTRVHQLGPQGFRAVLWHQGEADVRMPSNEYQAKLKNTILSSIEDAGWEFPWFVAQVSYHNPENPRYDSVRDAQKRLWDERVAEPGPDTDVLTGDHRDFDGKGIHFSPKGLKAHGEMWAEKLLPYVEARLAAQLEPSDVAE